MMKFLFSNTLLFFLLIDCTAQIQITLEADMPTADPSYHAYYSMKKTADFGTITAGPGGENLTWDFSKITGATADSSKFVDPAEYNTDLSFYFQGSNIAEVHAGNITYYNIGELNGKKFIKL